MVCCGCVFVNKQIISNTNKDLTKKRDNFLTCRMLRNIKTAVVISNRPYKNFGHKRQPIPVVTTVWHGFLTFTFIGLAIEWKKIKNILFGENNEDVFIKQTGSEEKV